MRHLTPVQRIAEQYSSATVSTYVCQSCRSRVRTVQQRPISTTIRSPSKTASRPSDYRPFRSSARLQADDVVSTKPEGPDPKDPRSDKNYVPALTWHDLERVGGKAWVEQQLDPGDKFVGYVMGLQAERETRARHTNRTMQLVKDDAPTSDGRRSECGLP